MECLIANAEVLFAEIKKKYAEYYISYQPFLIVKADAGTYGMAVMTVRNIDELKSHESQTAHTHVNYQRWSAG